MIAPTRSRRADYDRRQRIQGRILAGISTAAVIGLIIVIVPQLSGWPRVRETFFDGDAFTEAFPLVLRAFLLDLRIFFVCAPLIVIFGMAIALARSVRSPILFPLRLGATLYVDIVRGVPILLWLFLIGFGGAGLINRRSVGFGPIEVGTLLFLGGLALVIVYSAYVAEVFRAGIESVHESQRSAARSLGLTTWQANRYVVLPQAVRRVVPPAHERLHQPPEGRRPGVGAGAGRGAPSSRRAPGPPVQLHAVRGRGDPVPVHLDPAHPHGRLPARQGAPGDERYGSAMKLQIREVVKRFGPRTVLDHLSLDVEPSQVICLIGASGSGKSTLLRCINLLEPIDDGVILLDGDDISEPGRDPDPIRRRIGLVFQSFNLFPHMTVAENISLAPRKVLGHDKARAHAETMALLEQLSLADKANEYPDRLSGGQQQRVAIARSLAMQPDVMLLDEITSALDPELVGEVLDVVRELKREGMTMLFATHEMGFAREIADQMCFLHEGRILEQAPPDQLLGQPSHDRTRQFLQRVTEAGRM